MDRQRGFTLIELLVILAILSVLAGLTLNAIGDVRARALDVKSAAELETVQRALAVYMLTTDTTRVTPSACAGDFAASTPALFPAYLNQQYSLSGHAYAWNQEGDVTYCTTGSTAPLGRYFATRDLSGAPAITRADATIDFNWGAGSPDISLPANDFSVRWEFTLQAAQEGNYRFTTSSDDGIRVWVNGIKIIDRWNEHPVTVDYGLAALTPGTYPVQVEYYERSGLAVVRLAWDYVGP